MAATSPAGSDPGRQAGGSGSGSGDAQRRCIASGVVADRALLIRFVVAPDGILTPDVDERLPGRGIWLSADRDLLNRAKRKNLFGKAARRAVRVSEDLEEQVEFVLARRCIGTLGLARRAGQAVFGFERTREWLDSGHAALVVEAADGSPASLAKVRADREGVALARSLTAVELGAAAGRDRIVHGAVAAGALAERLVRDDRRLAGFRRRTEAGPDNEPSRRRAAGMDRGERTDHHPPPDEPGRAAPAGRGRKTENDGSPLHCDE